MLAKKNQIDNASYSIKLAFVICIFSLLLAGCALKLFEYQIDKDELSLLQAQKANEKIIEKAQILESRPEPLIEESVIFDSKRLIRRDLQNSIDKEWHEGWKYLENMEMNTYASTIEGNDGLLVGKKALRRFDPGDSRKYGQHSIPGVKLSFIHLSDVQLRDEKVYMFRKKLTNFLDLFSDGFDHEPDLVFYDYSYYLTQIGAMRLLKNRLPEDQRPSFMIHTGDAIHMGVVSEIYDFIYITNQLTIPWFNALGNHDYQVYGNLSSEDVGVIDPNMSFQTVSSRYNFINMHGKGFAVDKQVYFSPLNAPHQYTTNETKSVYNGFDRNGDAFMEDGSFDERQEKPCKHCGGYYHFEAVKPKGNNPGILIVVLDTSIKDFRFAKGTVSRDQLNWLRYDVLEEYSKKGNWMVLVFGHHALDSFFDKKRSEDLTTLFHNPRYNVVAYFCGHSHEHLIKYHKNSEHPKAFGFWEITTDGIMEYPKKGSLVNVIYTKEGHWNITLQSFWPYFLENLPDDAPTLLKNAKKCFEASKIDDEGKKKMRRYSNLDPKHHDAILEFSFPKSR
jgi:hypothetical protein